MSRESDELGAEQHYAQFNPDPPTGEPSMFAPGELERINQHIADRMGEPLELDEWWDAIDEELANLPVRVVESATGGQR